jgi:hypothetical protein
MNIAIEKGTARGNSLRSDTGANPSRRALTVPPAASARPLATAITLDAPLIGVESARLALRCGEDDVLEWILSGDLEWAFDLRRKGARRACCRILTESVIRKQQRGGRLTPRERKAQKTHPFEEIFDSLFTVRRPVLYSSELARAWNCGTSHIHNLIADGLLPIVRKYYAPRESYQFPRQEVFAFMQSRRMK